MQWFTNGGIFMYVVLGGGLLLYAGILHQSRRPSRRAQPLLWAGVAALLMLGALGTVIGQAEGFSAVARRAGDAAMAAQVISTSLTPTVLAVAMAIPAVLGLGALLARDAAAWHHDRSV